MEFDWNSFTLGVVTLSLLSPFGIPILLSTSVLINIRLELWDFDEIEEYDDDFDIG